MHRDPVITVQATTILTPTVYRIRGFGHSLPICTPIEEFPDDLGRADVHVPPGAGPVVVAADHRLKRNLGGTFLGPVSSQEDRASIRFVQVGQRGLLELVQTVELTPVLDRILKKSKTGDISSEDNPPSEADIPSQEHLRLAIVEEAQKRNCTFSDDEIDELVEKISRSVARQGKSRSGRHRRMDRESRFLDRHGVRLPRILPGVGVDDRFGADFGIPEYRLRLRPADYKSEARKIPLDINSNVSGDS